MHQIKTESEGHNLQVQVVTCEELTVRSNEQLLLSDMSPVRKVRKRRPAGRRMHNHPKITLFYLIKCIKKRNYILSI